MKICMVTYDMQEFGGLEEYAVNLSVSLQQQGHQVCMFSTAWVSPENQYMHRLREKHIPLVQMPKWISQPASDWDTKEKILCRVMKLFGPLIYLLGVGIFLLKRRSWGQSLTSARNWLKGLLMDHIIGPDRRKPLARVLLNWWRLRWNPDLVHLHGYTTNLLFVIDWAYDKKVPVVYVEHQTPNAQFDWWQGFEKSINKVDLVIATSERNAQALRTICGVTQPIVVAGTIVPDPITFGWQKDYSSRQGDKAISITTVARLNVAKGLTYLLDAVAQVKAIHPDAEFRVYGDGELRHELLTYANSLGLDGAQIFVGAFTNREELSRIMARTDIFVMSSVLEGQPLSVIEAMAYGCPIVTTDVGGIPEVLQDGINGLLCKPKDPQCLVEKISSLIEDPDLRQRLGSAARMSYEQGPFLPKAVSSHFISIYSKVLAERSVGRGSSR